MPVISNNAFAGKPEALEQYFSSGYVDFEAFHQSIDWKQVKIYEKNPDSIWQGPVQISNDRSHMLIGKHELLNDACVKHLDNQPIDYFEFGVRSGTSMRAVIQSSTHADSRFYGFDTFEGLPEGWVSMHGNRKTVLPPAKPGTMAVDAIPVFDDKRVQLCPGLFQKTLPALLSEAYPAAAAPRAEDRPKLINVDGDTYTAGLYVLTAMHPYLRPQDLIYFDEFSDVLNEFMAFNDYIRSYYLKDHFKLLGRAYDGFLFRYAPTAG